MAKLIEITGKALAGEWGTDDVTGEGIPVLRTTNFTNEGVVDYSDVVTRKIAKKNIDEKFLREGDIIIEKSGGSDKYPVGRVIYFDLCLGLPIGRIIQISLDRQVAIYDVGSVNNIYIGNYHVFCLWDNSYQSRTSYSSFIEHPCNYFL